MIVGQENRRFSTIHNKLTFHLNELNHEIKSAFFADCACEVWVYLQNISWSQEHNYFSVRIYPLSQYSLASKRVSS